MTNYKGVTLLGLGPGDPELLTRQAWALLESIPEIYLRTRQHPVVDGLPATLQVHSFDSIFDGASTFEEVYEQIVRQVLTLGERPEGVVYAVPGSPFVAEATSPEIARRARAAGIPVQVIAGLSFLEPVFAALSLDPFPKTSLADALELAVSHTPPFPTSVPAVIAQIHSQAVATEVKLTLMSLYPDDHPVQLVHAVGTLQQQVENLHLYEIDRSEQTGLLSALYLPPLGTGTSFEDFLEIIAHLRAPEDGCPWDKEQTHRSLRPYLLEETYETLDALDADDSLKMSEEFGDLLLQIVLHAQIASEEGEFNIVDVLRGVYWKIVNRHPHVFGDVEVKDAQGVLQNWERLKEKERAAAGNHRASMFEGISKTLPALSQAEEIQRRAARVGFDWPEIQGVMEKVDEEMGEVRSAQNSEERAAELGDLLFAVVNLARWYEVDAESALREASTRFRSRFAQIEQSAQEQGRSLSDLTLDEMEAIWQASKKKL